MLCGGGIKFWIREGGLVSLFGFSLVERVFGVFLGC